MRQPSVLDTVVKRVDLDSARAVCKPFSPCATAKRKVPSLKEERTSTVTEQWIGMMRERCVLLFDSNASADRVEERSLIPRSRSHARLKRNATMSHALSCVRPAFIETLSRQKFGRYQLNAMSVRVAQNWFKLFQSAGHTFDCNPDPTSVFAPVTFSVSVPVQLVIQFRSASILVSFAILCPAFNPDFTTSHNSDLDEVDLTDRY
ncbi:hypothetical protein EVAR_74790_1 [Eumeta japonica]|uniref:Uncharacterized protein n=1 Tax=Eumeta variegata TaxID=151549 RepID=A0A4C1SP65_EUMVA|nr:hypothetical protein EVAR_74790_1 [Eumeta japonica]